MTQEAVENAAPTARRKPWAAGLFSLITPGLGHMYNGQMKKGLFWYGLTQIIPVIFFLFILSDILTPPMNIWFPLLVGLLIYLWICIDAIRMARRLGDLYQRKAYNKWYLYLAAIVIAGYVIQPIVSSAVQNYLIKPYKIPSGAMKETLQIGDHVLVDRFRYRSTLPQPFDIIVFQYPWEDQRDFVKRIVALPGDQVEMRNQQVFINGQSLEEPYVAPDPRRTRPYRLGPIRIPKQGDVLEIRTDKRLYINGEPVTIPDGRFRPDDSGPSLSGFQTFYGPLFPNQGVTLDRPVEPFQVGQDYYFTLGDNRKNSKDSRYWGFVRRDLIKGKTSVIYWSWDCRTRRMDQYVQCLKNFAQHVRWERIGRSLQ